MKKILVSSLLLITTFLKAQTNSAEIFIELKKLNVLGSVLYIAAHPDDENNTLLPYLAKEKLYRTAYLSLTRGDGGQNLIGDEQGIELGMIRTQELLAARRIDGGEQYFTNAYEFGYSKTAEETLNKWNRLQLLYEIVWNIRKFQPDIIINRFPQDGRAGHGHHAASAILAQEAFIAAADTTKFPEQFTLGVQPWQAKRLLWNTFNFGNNNTTNNNQLKLEVGNYNPLLGLSYGEVGGIARTMHKSQGEGRPKRKGNITEYFAYVNGDSATTDIMNRVNTTWSRLEGTSIIQQKINEVIAEYNFANPQSSVSKLVTIYNLLSNYPTKNNWVTLKIKEIENLIIKCSGLFIEATSSEEALVQGQKATFNFFSNNRSDSNIKLSKISLSISNNNTFDSVINLQLLKNSNYSFSKECIIPLTQPVTQPYWLTKPILKNMFHPSNQAMLGEAENSPLYIAKFFLNIDGTDFTLNVPIQFKMVHPVRGEIYEPLIIVPPITVNLTPNNILLHIQQNKKIVNSKNIQLQVTSNINALKTSVTISLHQANNIVYAKDTILDLKNAESYAFNIAISNLKNYTFNEVITPSVQINYQTKEQQYTQDLKNISYEHIPNLHYFFTNETKFINEKIITKPLKVGYINGAGDKVAEAIEQMGYIVTQLTEKDLNIETLKQYNAIVIGIRAYNIHEYLTDKNNVLNAFVKNGGNLIVQYIKSNSIGTKAIQSGPYSFTVNSRSRITEEDAKVKFLLPNHTVLNYPNKISSADFENWVQERSTYQAEKFDSNFECILGMNDTGEKETNSSLLIAKYGKGNYVYCSLALFRQLPAGIAGSYKLLANMLELEKH